MSKIFEYHVANGISLSKIVFFAVLFLAFQNTFSQSIPESEHWPKGYPEVTSFTNQTAYIGASQTYQAAEDSRGVMYFGNLVHGVQIYRGDKWIPLNIRGSAHVISMFWHDERNRMYVAGVDFFGYITANSTQEYHFVDLTNTHSLENFSFNRVNQMHKWGENIILQMENKLLVWDGSELTLLFESDPYIYSLNVIDTDFWIHLRGGQLLRGDGRNLEPEDYPSDVRPISLIVSNEDGSLRAISRSGKFLRYESNTVPRANSSHQTLSEEAGNPTGTPHASARWVIDESVSGFNMTGINELHRIIQTRDGSFAAATGINGVLFINTDGSLRYHLTSDHGLSANTVSFLFEDRNGNIWASSGNGISMIEYASPFRLLRGEQAVPGNTSEIATYQGRLFATDTKTYEWIPSEREWVVIGESMGRVANIRSGTKNLFAMSASGLFQYQNGRMRQVYPYSMYDVQFSRANPNIMYGLNGGPWFKLFQLDDDGNYVTRLAQFNLGIRLISVHEASDGSLWIGTGSNILHITGFHELENGEYELGEITTYGTEHGLPPGNYNYTANHGDEVLFITMQGLHSFAPDQNRFIPAEDYLNAFQESERASWPVVHDNFNRLWIDLTGLRLGYLDLNSEPPYTWYWQPFRRHGPYQHINRFLSPSEHEVYTSSQYAISRFDLTMLDNVPLPPNAILSSVVYSADSLISGGATPLNHILEEPLDYNRLPMIFEWGSTSHLPKKYRWFQTKLEGFDEDWSARNQETRREFTNLPSGRYEFRVRTYDIYNQVSPEAVFEFRIRPPWYASIGAYITYGLFFIALMLGLLHWRTARLESQKRDLQITVDQRTREIEAARRKAEDDRLIIQQQNEKIRQTEQMRNRLFADITHEFRTPITISLGLMGKLQQDIDSNSIQTDDVITIKRNLKRLNRMMDQVIDITKFDNNVLVLHPIPVLAQPLVVRIAESFRSLAESKQQAYLVTVEAGSVTVEVDPDKLESIVNNLIHNAIKFTPEMGTVRVNISSDADKFRLRVEDSGPGIPSDNVEAVFDRFFRVKNEAAPYQEGMGLGLELSRTLARKMGGDITLDAGRLRGCAFELNLPVSEISIDLENVSEPEADASQDVVATDLPTYSQSETPSDISMETLSNDQAEPQEAVFSESRDNWNILVVEDNDDMRKYVIGILEPFGEIKSVADGIEALDLMVHWKPDLVISDLMMPRLDGVELTRRMTEDGYLNQIPVLILTAKSLREDRLELLRLGVADYISKPFDKEELQLRVRSALKNYSARKKIQVDIKNQSGLMEQAPSAVAKAAQYIYSQIGQREISADLVASELNMSRSTLYRYIKTESGLTFGLFLRELKLRYAREILLKDPSITLEDLACKAGFQKASWFSKVFFEHYGCRPHEMAKKF